MNDLPRLGGLLSFLLRESPVGSPDMAHVDLSALPPLLRSHRREREPAASALSPQMVVELLNTSMVLYSLRVVSSVKQVGAFCNDERKASERSVCERGARHWSVIWCAFGDDKPSRAREQITAKQGFIPALYFFK